jgi:hypothetical protein
VHFGAFFGLFAWAFRRFGVDLIGLRRRDSHNSRLLGEAERAQPLGLLAHGQGCCLVLGHGDPSFLRDLLQPFELCLRPLALFFSFAWQTLTPCTNEGAASSQPPRSD